MFAKSVIALAAIASFAVAAPIEKRGPPADWKYGYLEDYDTYHVRYLALKCHTKKNTDYFQDCCRPMLATENLQDNRKAYCVPSKEATAYVVSSLSAKAAGPTASATASADEAAESEYCESEESVSTAAAASTTPAAAPAVAAPTTASPAASPAATTKVGEQYQAPAPSSSSSSSSSSTSTSTTPAWTPAPTTSTTPAWTPAPAPTTTQQAASQQQQQSSGGETFNGGFATYFFQNGNPGACGNYNSDGAMIVAIDQARWGSSSFGGGSSTCGRWLTITNTNNGRSVSAMVADVCPTCVNGNSLDLSQGAFRAIANDADGMVPISWHWN